jgi:hypothetical protein
MNIGDRFGQGVYRGVGIIDDKRWRIRAGYIDGETKRMINN